MGRHRPPQNSIDMESPSSKVGDAHRYLSKKGNVEDLSDGLCYLLRVKNAYPELIKLLGIVVSTAPCERSFSCLKRLKTYLRATMSQERMALLVIERDLSIDLEEAIDKFSVSNHTDRRLQLLPIAGNRNCTDKPDC